MKSVAKPATLLEVTLLHGCFSSFLNCTNGNKSHKASHIVWAYSVTQGYACNFSEKGQKRAKKMFKEKEKKDKIVENLGKNL